MEGSALIWRIDHPTHTIFDRPTLIEFDADATCLAWSRDSALLAIGTFDGTVIVIADRSESARFSRGKSPIVAIDFHSSPDIIVFADARGLVCIARRGAIVAHVALDGNLCDVFWATDDAAVAACDQRLHSITIKGGHHVVANAKSAIVQAVLDRTRQFVAIGDDAGFVSIIDIAQRATAAIQMLHRGGVRGVALSAAPGTFASVGADGGVKMFTVGRGETREFVGHAAATYLAACDPKGRWLASVGAEGVVAVWGVEARKVLISYNVGQAPVNCLAWEPEGRFLAVGMDSGAVAIIDFQQLPFH
jgi:WD40 repeat protein